MKLRTVLGRFAVAAAVWAFLWITYLPLHEYGHCAFTWGQGSREACSVVYYHPTSQHAPSWICREENSWGPNGTVIGRVLICSEETTAQHTEHGAFAMTGHESRWFEHPVLYGLVQMVYVAILLPLWAWVYQGVKTYLAERGGVPA